MKNPPVVSEIDEFKFFLISVEMQSDFGLREIKMAV